jgi:Flp pilus assembly pilin Flp
MNQKAKWIPSLLRRGETGQALVEYALILVLVAMALIAALIATGPAIANVFSNTVCNLVGLEDCSPDSLVDIGGGPESFWMTVTWVAMNPPVEKPNPTAVNGAATDTPEVPNTFTPTPITATATLPPTEPD